MSIVKHLKIAMSTSTKSLEDGCKKASERLNKVDFAATKVLTSLQDSIRGYTMGGQAAEAYALKQKGVNQALIDQISQARQSLNAIEQARAAQEASAAADAKKIQAQNALNQSARQHLASLRDEIRVFQMGAVEAERYKLALQGIDSTTRNNIAAARNHIAQLHEQKRAKEALAASARHVQRELENEAEAWKKLTRTPKERAHAQFGRLNQLNNAGLLSEDTFQRSRQHIIDELRKIEEGAKKVGTGSSFSGLLTTLAKVGAAIYAVRMAFDGLKAIVGTPLKLAAEFEKTHIAMTTLLGSATLSMALLKEAEEFAAVSPFSSDDINQSLRQMLAMGYGVGEVTDSLKQLADMAAGSGASLQHLSLIFSQGRASQKWMSKDFYQLANLGIPAISELQKVLGVDTPAAVYKAIEAGEVMDSTMQQVLKNMTSAGGKYYKATEAQSKSMAGMWEQLGDQVGLTAKAIGQEMIKAWDLKSATKSMTDFVQMLREDYMPTISTMLSLSKNTFDYWKNFAASIDEATASMKGFGNESNGSMLQAATNPVAFGLSEAYQNIRKMFSAGYNDELEKQQAHRKAALEQEKRAAEELKRSQEQAKNLIQQQTEATNQAADAMKRYADIAKKAFEDTRTPGERLRQELKEDQEAFNQGYMDLDTLRRARKQKIDKFLGFEDPAEAYNQELKKIEKQRDTGRITNDEFALKQGELKEKYLGIDYDEEAQKAKVGLAKLKENFQKGLITKEEMEKSSLALMPDILKKSMEESKGIYQNFLDTFKDFENEWKGILTPQQIAQARTQMYEDMVVDKQTKKSKRERPQFASFSTRGSSEAYQAIIRNSGGRDPQIVAMKVQQDQLKELKELNKVAKKNANKKSPSLPPIG